MSSPIFGQLEASLADYLCDVSGSTHRCDDRALARVARTELPRLVEALKAVLDEHAPDQFGRCPGCRSSRFGRTPTPCRAYLSAHLCLVAHGDEPPPAEGAPPVRRPVVLSEPTGLGVMNASG